MNEVTTKKRLVLCAASIGFLVSLDILAAQRLSSDYAKELELLLRHQRAITEAETILRKVHDAAGVMASYASTKNPEFARLFSSTVDQVHDDLRRLRDAGPFEPKEQLLVQSADKQTEDVVQVLGSLKHDVDDNKISLEQMRSHDYRRQISETTHALENSIDSFTKLDLGYAPSAKQSLLEAEVIGLSLFNALYAFAMTRITLRPGH